MTDQELQKLLDILKYVPEDRRDETTNAVLKAAADSISLEKIKSLTDIQDDTQQKSTERRVTHKVTPLSYSPFDYSPFIGFLSINL